MSEVIEVHLREGQSRASAIHHLPCKIKHDGPAKVSTYFVPTEESDGKGTLRRTEVQSDPYPPHAMK